MTLNEFFNAALKKKFGDNGMEIVNFFNSPSGSAWLVWSLRGTPEQLDFSFVYEEALYIVNQARNSCGEAK